MALPAPLAKAAPAAPAPRRSAPVAGPLPGTATGQTAEAFMAALAAGAKCLLFGENMADLNRMLPYVADGVVLQVVAEGHILHHHAVVEHLAQAIHHRAHLIAEAKPVLHLVLAELIANAVEHGNLGLTHARNDMVSEAAWFDRYQKKVQEVMETPLGRVPVLVMARRVGGDLEVTVEDRGMGFDVREVMGRVKKGNPHTGRGLGLVFELLDERVHYDNDGRRVTFSLPVRARAEQAPLPTRATARAQGRILVIDDDKVNLRVADQAYKKAGFGHVLTCNDASRAMAEVRRFRPDMIVLDIIMPEVDGYALCAEIKADPAFKEVPVIFFTGYSDAKHRTQGYQAGAVDFVSKPIDPVELVARTEVHLLNGLMMRTLQAQTERLNADLERARMFQHDLLPSPERLVETGARHRLDIATTYQACETLAGDYWNILEVDDGHVAVCLVDFTGHGVLAALNTVRLHTLLHHDDSHLLGKPVLMAQNLNHHLHQLLGAGSFATFTYGVLDTQSGAFVYAGGGAPPALIKRRDGSMESLPCSGLPLGLGPEIEVLPRRARLAPGDTLVLVSDAVPDSLHGDGRRWEMEGLARVLGEIACAGSAKVLLNGLLDAFYATVKLPVEDDLTAVAITLGRGDDACKDPNGKA